MFWSRTILSATTGKWKVWALGSSPSIVNIENPEFNMRSKFAYINTIAKTTTLHLQIRTCKKKPFPFWKIVENSAEDLVFPITHLFHFKVHIYYLIQFLALSVKVYIQLPQVSETSGHRGIQQYMHRLRSLF